MNQLFDRIGHAITSMAAVIIALVLTISAMTFFSHTLFYQIFPLEMAHWEKSIATWILACAWELSVLVTSCNVIHIHRRVPIAMAICSGFILILFLHGFDSNLSMLEYIERWFIGSLVATINITFSTLFYSKWCLAKEQKALGSQLSELQLSHEHARQDLNKATTELKQSRIDFDQLFVYTEELEQFKAREVRKLTCMHCHVLFENIYFLNSHKANCQNNPSKGRKQSIFDDH